LLASATVSLSALGWIGASELLTLLPALLLGCVLLARRYPGERVLIARHGHSCAPHTARPTKLAKPGRKIVLLTARGGLLMARSLAVRPPPLLPVS
jgi:hypothetical protein